MIMKITLTTRSVGPADDPYSRETLRVTADNGNVAERVMCALAGDTVRLLAPDGTVLREFKPRLRWQGAAPNAAQCDRTKLNLLFKRHVGVTATDAEDEFHRLDFEADRAMYAGMTPEAESELRLFNNAANFM
jgi:hypothetical protein